MDETQTTSVGIDPERADRYISDDDELVITPAGIDLYGEDPYDERDWLDAHLASRRGGASNPLDRKDVQPWP